MSILGKRMVLELSKTRILEICLLIRPSSKAQSCLVNLAVSLTLLAPSCLFPACPPILMWRVGASTAGSEE